MKPFDHFISTNEVRKVTPDLVEAKSILEDAEHRFEYFSNIETKNDNAKFIVENLYEAVREILDAILLIDGFKSYSHQAPISYAKEKGILSYKLAAQLDYIRDFRNKSKYYGKKIEFGKAQEYIGQAKTIYDALKEHKANLLK